MDDEWLIRVRKLFSISLAFICVDENQFRVGRFRFSSNDGDFALWAFDQWQTETTFKLNCCCVTFRFVVFECSSLKIHDRLEDWGFCFNESCKMTVCFQGICVKQRNYLSLLECVKWQRLCRDFLLQATRFTMIIGRSKHLTCRIVVAFEMHSCFKMFCTKRYMKGWRIGVSVSMNVVKCLYAVKRSVI